MNTSWQTISLAALSALWMTTAADAREKLPGDRTITVIVWDYAAVSDGSLEEMETLSGLLLLRAGIGTEWVHCGSHLQGPQPALCDGNLGKGSVLLRIVGAYPGNQKQRGDPLGTAMVESGYASIYATEIHRYAAHNGLTDGALMAYAATHEIGHLLLGPQHSLSGIMRAVWGEAEYRGMEQRWLGFGAAEQHDLLRAVPASDQRAVSLH